MLLTMCGLLCCLVGWYGGPCAVVLVDLGGRFYFRWKLGMLNKTSSHMWCSWYLSIFLLRNGSLTLMNIDSLMVLAMVCDSLPTMGKFSNLVWWPEVLAWLYMGKVPWGVPLAFPQGSLQTTLCTPHYTPTYGTCTCILLYLFVTFFLSLGATRRLLMVLNVSAISYLLVICGIERVIYFPLTMRHLSWFPV